MAQHPAIQRARNVANYATMAQLAVDTLNAIHREVAKQVQISERVNAITFMDEHKYESAQDPGATGIATFYHQSGDAAWVCERVTIVQSGAGTVNFYLGSAQPINLVETVTVPASGIYSDQFANTLYVPRGVSLIATGLNGIAVKMQIRKLRPHKELLSQEEIYAEQSLTQDELEAEYSGDYTGADAQPTADFNPILGPPMQGENIAGNEAAARPNPNLHFANVVDIDEGTSNRGVEFTPGEDDDPSANYSQTVPGVSHMPIPPSQRPGSLRPNPDAHMPPGGLPQ